MSTEQNREKIQGEQQLLRDALLRSISENGILKPSTMEKMGFQAHKAADVGSTHARDFNRVCGVVYITPEQSGVHTTKREVPGSSTQMESVDMSMEGQEYHQRFYTQGEVDLREEVLEHILNDPFFGINTVLIERAGEHTDDLTRLRENIISDRIQNSFVVVTNTSGIKGEDANAYRMEDIPPEEFLKVLVPQNLIDTVAKRFPADLVVSVSMIETTLEVSSALQTSKRRVQIPDYKSAIRALGEQVKRPLFIHGVRLPTLEDAGLSVSSAEKYDEKRSYMLSSFDHSESRD